MEGHENLKFFYYNFLTFFWWDGLTGWMTQRRVRRRSPCYFAVSLMHVRKLDRRNERERSYDYSLGLYILHRYSQGPSIGLVTLCLLGHLEKLSVRLSSTTSHC